MKILNTLTRKKEEFTPLHEGRLSMYVCGPTVYNLIHIGNARPMIVFDTFRRYMEYRGYDVNYVSNFTDVDDKIIKRANEEGVDASVISERYIEECKRDMAALNVKPATTHPKATEEIGGMIDMITTLIEKGYAYDAGDGTVYYRTKSFRDYGKLSHKNLEDLEAGHRDIAITGGEGKEDYMDFVLWKPKKEGEIYWDSPWGQGSPGWHIECSVMAKKYLGDEIDIHAGGEDLIFPHHENEIAQSEAANGVPFARYWMHNGFLNIDNQKMSKSAGNFFTVRDICKKYDPMVLRFFMLQAHYRGPLNFSDTLMESAKKSLERIRTCRETLSYNIANSKGGKITEVEKNKYSETEKFVRDFEDAMDDDCNTADAVTAVFELVRFINANSSADSSKEYLQKLEEKLLTLTDVLGLVLDSKAEDADPGETKKIEELLAERTAAKKAKDFARADEIRDELKSMGVTIEDTREGVKWKKA